MRCEDSDITFVADTTTMEKVTNTWTSQKSDNILKKKKKKRKRKKKKKTKMQLNNSTNDAVCNSVDGTMDSEDAEFKSGSLLKVQKKKHKKWKEQSPSIQSQSFLSGVNVLTSTATYSSEDDAVRKLKKRKIRQDKNHTPSSKKRKISRNIDPVKVKKSIKKYSKYEHIDEMDSSLNIKRDKAAFVEDKDKIKVTSMEVEKNIVDRNQYIVMNSKCERLHESDIDLDNGPEFLFVDSGRIKQEPNDSSSNLSLSSEVEDHESLRRKSEELTELSAHNIFKDLSPKKFSSSTPRPTPVKCKKENKDKLKHTIWDGNSEVDDSISSSNEYSDYNLKLRESDADLDSDPEDLSYDTDTILPNEVNKNKTHGKDGREEITSLNEAQNKSRHTSSLQEIVTIGDKKNAAEFSFDDRERKCFRAKVLAYLGRRTFDVDFEVPELHQIVNRASQPTEEQRAELKSKGLTVKYGKFTRIEDKQILENWKYFIEVNSLIDSPKIFFYLKQHLTPLSKQNFLYYLARNMPTRTVYSVFKRFKILMSRRKEERNVPTFEETSDSISGSDHDKDANESGTDRGAERWCKLKIKKYLAGRTFHVDFDVPELHDLVNRASKPTAEQRAQLAQNGIAVKYGKFVAEEDRQIMENWGYFVEVNGLIDNPELFFCLDKKYISPVAKQNFLYYLARNMPTRTVYSVFRRFKILMSQRKKGRFTEEEDDFIKRELKAAQGQRIGVKQIAQHLGRDRDSVERRIKKIKNRYTRKIKWKKKNAEAFIKYLLKVTKIPAKNIKELEHRHITSKEWIRLSKELDDVPVRKLQSAWIQHLYPALFIPGPFCDLRQVKIQLIKMFCDNHETDWRKVDWNYYASHFPGLTNLKIYTLLQQLIHAHVPDDKRKNLNECLEILRTVPEDRIKELLLCKIEYKNGQVHYQTKKEDQE